MLSLGSASPPSSADAMTLTWELSLYISLDRFMKPRLFLFLFCLMTRPDPVGGTLLSFEELKTGGIIWEVPPLCLIQNTVADWST